MDAELTPEVVQQMLLARLAEAEHAVASFAERVHQAKATAADALQRAAQAEHAAATQVPDFTGLSAAIATGLANHIPAPAAPHTPRLAMPKIELPAFKGGYLDNATSWLDTLEAHRNLHHVADADWGVIASGLLRDEAAQWYHDRKIALGHTLTWTELRAELSTRFSSAFRTDELRNILRSTKYNNDMEAYITRFRKIVTQISDTDMTFGDKRAYFLDPLPLEIASRIRTKQPPDLETCYTMARDWSRARHIGSGGRGSTNHQSGGRNSGRGGHTGGGRLLTRLTGPVVGSNPQGPGPMDLDVMVPRRTPGRGGAPLSTRIAPQGSAHPEARCFNCNGRGHFSRDCRQPRRPRATGNSQPRQQLSNLEGPDSPNVTDDLIELAGQGDELHALIDDLRTHSGCQSRPWIPLASKARVGKWIQQLVCEG